jgi:ParB-like chromosome segregation protein Spo0J
MLGINYRVVEHIPLEDIDREEGMRRQVRLINKVDDDVVLKYAEAMQRDGSAFPYTILQEEKKRKWPWSGNHRLAAADLAGIQQVDAYMVSVTDPVMMDLLPRLVNTWEAVKGMSKEESLINARYMVDTHGMSPQEAASLFGVKVESIHKERRVEEVKQKVRSLGVDPNGFSDSILNDLYRLTNNNTLRKAAKIIHHYNVKGVEARQIVSDADKSATEAQAISQLERWEGVLEARLKPKRKKAGEVKLPHKEVNKDRFIKLITSFRRFLEVNTTVERAQVTDPAVQALILSEWKQVHKLMTDMLGGKK